MEIVKIKLFEGRSVWNHRPVLQACLLLKPEEQLSTEAIPDFATKLLELLPGLQEHQCGNGRSGGFCERLVEGTYLAHVVEHVALELQSAAGFSVAFGKTIRVKDYELWDLAIEYGTRALGVAALQEAVALVSAVRSQLDLSVELVIARLDQLGRQTVLGPSTASILQACQESNIPVLPLGEGGLYQLGYGCRQKVIEATITSQTSAVAVDLASDKLLTKQLLAEAMLPVPDGRVVTTWQEARGVAVELGFPLVVKPCHGHQGHGVALNLGSLPQLEVAFRIAVVYDRQVLVEKQVEGKHYRLLVIDGKLVAAAERLPASVTGDGSHTVKELVELANHDPLRGEGYEQPLTRIALEPVSILDLARQGLTPDSCPSRGTWVVLRQSPNLSTGGRSVDVTDQVHPDQRRLAEDAVRLVGLDVAGVDLVADDISRPLHEAGSAIIEVNAAPGFRMHLYPWQGEGRQVGRVLVDYLFPPGTKTSIPVLAVTGTNGKTTTARLLCHLFKQCCLRVGMATTGGIYIDGQCVCNGDTTGPASARVVLRHPEVELAILETAGGGILRGGLGYDLADVAVVTNIGSDHLGQDGIETLEDLCWVKSLVVEAVKKDGFVILNADDPFTPQLASRAQGAVIYFSCSGASHILCSHLGVGGCALFVKDGSVYIGQGDESLRLIGLKSIRIGVGGRAVHNLENALAAAAAAYACGLSPAQIRRGLRSFGTQQCDNPGRLMMRQVGKVSVIIDFGHNAPAFKRITEFARSLKPRRLIGVVGVPGDRADDQILAAGEVAGAGFDQLYIKEDHDRRGRQPNETARLLYTGARRAGLATTAVEIITGETEAIERALCQAHSGDLVVIFYEQLELVLAIIKQAQAVAEKELENRKAVQN